MWHETLIDMMFVVYMSMNQFEAIASTYQMFSIPLYLYTFSSIHPASAQHAQVTYLSQGQLSTVRAN